MTDGEAAIELVEVSEEIEAINLQVTRLQNQREVLNRKHEAIERQLSKTVGRNIPEKMFLVDNVIVAVRTHYESEAGDYSTRVSIIPFTAVKKV